MTITTQRTTANSPAQAAKNRVRGPTVAARRRGAADESDKTKYNRKYRILQPNSLARHWARDWRAHWH